MSAILNTLLTVDWSRVSAEIKEGLQNKKMILSSSQGSVYWAAGSGATGKVQDLPLVPVSPQDLASAEQLLQVGQAVNGAKMAAVSATAIGTAVVVVAVVVATAYLADKIDKVDRSVKEVAQTVGQQDQREYLKRMSDYTGLVMAARELLQPHMPQSEISSQAVNQIENLANARQKLLRYVQQLPQLISSLEKTNEAQYDLAFRLMIGVLDLMPSAIAVERELCLAANKPVLAKTRSDLSASDFRQALAGFRTWCNEQYQLLALGKGGFADVLMAHRNALNALFNSLAHDILLGDRDTAFSWGSASTLVDPEIMDSSTTDSNWQPGID